MLRVMFIGIAAAWSLWWYADLYEGPLVKRSVDYEYVESVGMEKRTTYDTSLQDTYRALSQTPRTRDDWLGNIRHSKWSWQWWAMGLGPLLFSVIVAFIRR